MKIELFALAVVGSLKYCSAADVSFIILGNDDTEGRRMPEILEDMLGEEDTVVDTRSERGRTFSEYRDLAEGGEGIGRRLNNTEWTWVILQEEASISALMGIDDDVYGESVEAAEDLVAYIEAPGTGETVLFLTPAAGLENYTIEQEQQIKGYEGYAAATGKTAVPAGQAFLGLYNDEASTGDVPEEGAFADIVGDNRFVDYLNACAIYGTATGRDPRLLSVTAQGADEAEQATLVGACVKALNDAGLNFPTLAPADSTMAPTSPAPTVAPSTAAPTAMPTTPVPTSTPTTAMPTGSAEPSASAMPTKAPIVTETPTITKDTIAPVGGDTVTPSMATPGPTAIPPVGDVLNNNGSQANSLSVFVCTFLAALTTFAGNM